ncbi:retrovirus-related pol polyprotein from transposon TNT 1-94, partial [Tanacetum coccineum]
FFNVSNPQQFTPVYAAPIHHQHHHTLVNLLQQSVSPQPFISPSVTQQSQAEIPHWDSGLAVPTFQTSSNPRNQATIQDGRVIVQQVQGRQTQTGQAKVVKYYNCPGEGHMAKQYTQPKRPRNFTWFKEKLMLVEAQEACQILDEEQLEFILDPGIAKVQVAQQTIPQISAFQTEDLDAYDSDCDDISSAKVVLMANLSSCDSDVLSKVPYSDTYLNDMINQDVQEMSHSEQTYIDDFPDNEITSDSNIIPYSQYMQESQDAGIQDTNSSAPNDLLVLSLVEQMTDHVANLDKENQTNKMLIDSQMDDLIQNRNAKFAAFQQEIDTLKETLSNQEHDVISVIDDEDTLILEEESRSKMLDKQNDPISIKQKINISPIDYSKLNKIKEDFGKRFVTKKELWAEQAFWLKHSNYNPDTSVKSHTPVRIEAPSELSKVSLVNESLKKLKYQLASFEKVMKTRTTSDAITADKNVFEIQIKKLRIDNDQLLNQIMSQEIMHIVANSVDILDVKKSCVNDCNKCLELEIKLFKKKDFIEKEAYDKLVKSYSNLEKHCISLELATQLNKEIFQRENSGENTNAPTFNQLFKLNDMKAQSQEKDTVIRKLKERIKSLSGKDSVENVKKDIDEIETINIDLEHSVAKLLSENENLRKEQEHLKSIYKDQFDSIGKTRVQSKEHCDSLISQINAKSLENSDLHAQLQEKVFAITTMKNELRKLKRKHVNTVVSKPNAILAPRMFKLDIKPIFARLKNNRDAHEIYIDKTIEYADTLCGFVECTDSLKTKDSNKPLLTSTRVKPTTSASGSKPSGNTKNNRITRPPRSNQKNKVEDHPRKVKSSLNKTNFVSEPISNALVKHSMRNAKFEPMCAIYDKCLFDANHDMCLIDFVNSGCADQSLRNSHLKRYTPKSAETPKPEIKVYSRRPKQIKSVGSSKKAKIVESKIANNSEPTHLWGSNATDVPSSSSLVNDRLSRSSSGSRDTNLYTISLDDMLKTSPICLLSKASKTKSWLWHHRLSHLNFACALGKSKKSSHQPKAEDTNQEKLYLLHMDLCGPMRVESIKGKKYILIIVDHYSRFTWVKFLRSKDEALDAIIKCIKNIQVRLNATVRDVRTDNGTEFVNQTLRNFYENVDISHQTSVARTPQQNGVVERRNQTLVEAARTMLIFS